MLLLNPFPDFVIADDLIVQGSACVGLDCVNGETFNFDTIRTKENNTRIGFMDTSTAAGFATTDWTIRANSSDNGGGSFLAFVDQGATSTGAETGTITFEVDAGAPANSLRVASTGRIGNRTAAPALDNFFVRDLTGGSRLPFRIRPGAPTSSIDISAAGNVGIGTASPAGLVHIKAATNDTFLIRGHSNFADGVTLFSVNDVNTVIKGMEFGASSYFFGGGFVGIGTAAPTDNLSVNGTASKPGGGSWAVFSDERLKNIKGNFNSGLKAVMQLQPLRYEYKKNNALGLVSSGEHIGFGATALQKVIPEAVTSTSTGYLQVNNDPIIWTMLNAIKEQQKEIEELKSQVQKLKAGSRRRR
jgi:hypothetical protein